MGKRHHETIGSKAASRHLLVLTIVLAFGLILCRVPECPAAQEPPAQVIESAGPSFQMNIQGERRPISVGDTLVGGDIIECEPGGSVTLRLSDGSTVAISEGSRVALNRLLPQEKTRFSLSVFFGRLAMKIKRLRGDDMVLTPTLVAGVRGTEFVVSVADDGASVLSVTEGQVGIVTEKEGQQVRKVDLAAGQEVQVDETGAVLIARPVQIETLEEWQAFRRQRLTRMKENLPGIVDKLETEVDTNLENLKKLEAQPLDRAKVLEKLAERLEKLKPGQRRQRAQLIIKTHMEMGNVDSLVQQFRLRKMRIESAFVQSERLKTTVLPLIAEPTGSDYQAVDRGLSKLLKRKKEVQTEMVLIAQKFDQGLGPVSEFIKKLKEQQLKNK